MLISRKRYFMLLLSPGEWKKNYQPWMYCMMFSALWTVEFLHDSNVVSKIKQDSEHHLSATTPTRADWISSFFRIKKQIFIPGTFVYVDDYQCWAHLLGKVRSQFWMVARMPIEDPVFKIPPHFYTLSLFWGAIF